MGLICRAVAHTFDKNSENTRAMTKAIATTRTLRPQLSVVRLPKPFLHGQQRLVISEAHGYRVIPFDEIGCCQAESNYTSIHLVNGERIMVSKTLKWVEAQLNQQFLRVHQSWLINLLEVREFNLRENVVSLARNGSVPVSRSGQKVLIAHLKA